MDMTTGGFIEGVDEDVQTKIKLMAAQAAQRALAVTDDGLSLCDAMMVQREGKLGQMSTLLQTMATESDAAAQPAQAGPDDNEFAPPSRKAVEWWQVAHVRTMHQKFQSIAEERSQLSQRKRDCKARVEMLKNKSE